MGDRIKVCHFIDNGKFTNGAVELFAKTKELSNDFYCVKIDKDQSNNKDLKDLCIINFNELDNFINTKFKNYSIVVFHNVIEDYKFKILKNKGPTQIILWIGWGYDIYKYYDPMDFLTKKNKKFIQKVYSTSYFKDISVFLNLNRIKQNIKWHLKSKKKLRLLSNYVDFYAPPIYFEFELIKKLFPNAKVQYLDWNYSYHIKKEKELYDFKKLCILIGNSASAQNNHIESIELLSNIKLDFEAIIPLNYGGDTKYKNAVSQYADNKLNHKVIILNDFLNFNDYTKLLDQCQVGIFNSIRQQGMGNIIFLLNKGAKVFMNNHNPFYKYLKEKGITIFEIDNVNEKELTKRLSLNEIESNREIIQSLYGEETAISKTHQLAKKLKESFFKNNK